MECIGSVCPRAPDAEMLEELSAEPWYRGEMSRKEAERLLKRDGDFLVRKSATNPGSFVLTGMQDGQAKHLLLVDPEGTVSTGRPRRGSEPAPAGVPGRRWAQELAVRAPAPVTRAQAERLNSSLK